jgi:hypothetical protein
MTPSEVAQLKKIIAIVQSLVDGSSDTRRGTDKKRLGSGGVRIRRSGKELIAFRKLLKSERKAGVPVAAIAKKHGVSASYIYQLD